MPSRLQPLVVLSAILLCQCQQAPTSPGGRPETPSGRTANQSADPRSELPTVLSRTAAAFGGRSVTPSTLYPLLIEAAGSEVLLELVIAETALHELSRRGLSLTEDEINAERRRMVQALDEDEDRAVVMFGRLMEQRRLGPGRQRLFLQTNAALRKLTADEVELTPAVIRQQFELTYGPLFVCRIVAVPTLRDAQQVLELFRQGRSFSDLAVEFSTDPSRAQGGLLSPISTADSAYPQAIRNELPGLQPGEVSLPIAVDQSFILVYLERILERDQPDLDQVRDQLAFQARQRIESRLMRQKARELLSRVEVTVFDPVLRESWLRQRAELLNP